MLKRIPLHEPKSVGITNTISHAELAAIAAAIIHGYSHIATDSLTSMYQIKKQLSHLTPKPPPPPDPGKCPPTIHFQGNPPVTIAHSLLQSQIPRRYLGNEYADALARKSITTYSEVADTSIKTAGSEGNPSYNIYWLAKKYEEHRII